MDIVFATHNAHKRGEVEAIMRSVWPAVRLVEPLGDAPVEDGESFEANALIKARAAFESTGIPALADDSGICVDALGGAPGIDSAHYSGSRDDQANVDHLLSALAGVTTREAQFVCAAAFVGGGIEHTIEARWPGQVALRPAGAGGFGYDPVFVPDGSTVTAAELSAEEKNAVSHRAQAFRAMARYLQHKFG